MTVLSWRVDALSDRHTGCLIVELVDYRPSKPKDPLLETPEIQRVVCRPNSETIWKDICRLNENHGYKMTDSQWPPP